MLSVRSLSRKGFFNLKLFFALSKADVSSISESTKPNAPSRHPEKSNNAGCDLASQNPFTFYNGAAHLRTSI